MTLRLVTEARPIPWGRLSGDEQGQIKEAEAWIDAVRADAADQQFTPDSIDRNRSGRVLLIDGVRGSGKTSLMLTLLARLKGEKGYKRDDSPPKDTELRVLLPILDFDPLPSGMPIHGWLLEPWRREAEALETEAPSRGGADLTEQWAEVFERVVIGWARTAGESKGVIEKAIEYQEKAAGWVDTPTVWDKLVKSAVCRRFGCRKEDCKDNHPFVYVIAIDDVDLQVEQLPQLLHAIRLLHHPNVVYVLTAAFLHLSFVLELDYRHRHGHHGRHDEETWLKIRQHSLQLRDAFLQKAMPSHARISLRSWSADEVFGMAINSQSSSGSEKVPERDTVRARLAKEWSLMARDAGGLRIATARRAQHAIDHYMRSNIVGDSPLLPEEEQLRFVADLCGTSIEKAVTIDGGDVRWRFALNGQITTEQAATFRAWEGDRLTVMLTEQPFVSFLPAFERSQIQRGDDANRALFLQLAVEIYRVQAPALTWSPDAGIAATEARWKPQSSRIEGRALFYWPWLARPSASDVLKFGELARLMSAKSPGRALSDITEATVALWLTRSVNWQVSLLNKSFVKGEISLLDEAQSISFARIAQRLVQLCRYPDIDAEVHRWVLELVVMTAPYFGLPKDVGEAMRKALWIVELQSDGVSVLAEELKIVKNAIIRAQNGGVQVPEPTSQEFGDAAVDFLERRKEQSPSDGWWNWAGRSARKRAVTKERGAGKTASARPKRTTRRARRVTGA